MKRLLYAAALAVTSLGLSGCAGMLAGLGTAAPAPLASTTIDDQGLEATWKAFDVALDAINVLGDRGVIVPGTPRGKAVASAIRKVTAALVAAERFAAAGSSSDYTTALREAAAGFGELRTLIGGN